MGGDIAGDWEAKVREAALARDFLLDQSRSGAATRRSVGFEREGGLRRYPVLTSLGRL